MAKKIGFSQAALEMMEERGIKEEDVARAVETAENGGDKLYTESGDFLAQAKYGYVRQRIQTQSHNHGL